MKRTQEKLILLRGWERVDSKLSMMFFEQCRSVKTDNGPGGDRNTDTVVRPHSRRRQSRSSSPISFFAHRLWARKLYLTLVTEQDG